MIRNYTVFIAAMCEAEAFSVPRVQSTGGSRPGALHGLDLLSLHLLPTIKYEHIAHL